MSKLDPYSSDKLVEGLGIVFYVGMAVALLTALLGSPGWAFLLLVLGSSALVARTTLESVRPTVSRATDSSSR
jgi:multisubunit Na+/H+ antiporter MnhB subunit